MPRVTKAMLEEEIKKMRRQIELMRWDHECALLRKEVELRKQLTVTPAMFEELGQAIRGAAELVHAATETTRQIRVVERRTG